MKRKTGSWASLIDRSINKLEKLKAAALGGEMNDGTPAMEGSIEPEQPFDLIEEGDIAINIYHNVPPDFSRTTRLSTWTTWNQDVSFLAFSGFISAGIHRHSYLFFCFFKVTKCKCCNRYKLRKGKSLGVIGDVIRVSLANKLCVTTNVTRKMAKKKALREMVVGLLWMLKF